MFRTMKLDASATAVVVNHFDVLGSKMDDVAIIDIFAGHGNGTKPARIMAKRMQDAWNRRHQPIVNSPLPFTFDQISVQQEDLLYVVYKWVVFKIDFGPWKKGQSMIALHFDVLHMKFVEFDGLKQTDCEIKVEIHESVHRKTRRVSAAH